MTSNKMKSLLKGLRYISQVFESSGKEEEIQIGNPTDVKHVAHIGWDGPSANTATAPSWMNEFKSDGGFESGQGGGEDDSSVGCMSECGGRSRDLPKLPKSTRKAASEKGSPTKERSSDKTKRRSSNKGTSSSRRSKEVSDQQDNFSPWPNNSTGMLPEVPKKSRRKKKTKENVNGGSTRSTRRCDVDNMSDFMSETGSVRSMPQFDNRDDF